MNLCILEIVAPQIEGSKGQVLDMLASTLRSEFIAHISHPFDHFVGYFFARTAVGMRSFPKEGS